MPRHTYHWTVDLQQRFIEVLAATGSVKRACAAVGKTRAAAYNLRRRVGEDRFRAAWDAAVLVARDDVGDAVLAHALVPVEYVGVRHPVSARLMWRRIEPMLGRGLGVALVNRLDRAAARVESDARRRVGAEPFMCIIRQKSGGFSLNPPRPGEGDHEVVEGVLHMNRGFC
ncbi:MAG: hypothetical protein ABI898_11415 [Sphingomonadales bacterium]